MLGGIRIFLESSYHRLSLWYPVSFVLGILLYFSFPNYLFLILPIVFYIRKFGIISHFISNLLCFFLIGMIIVKIRLDSIDYRPLHDSIVTRIRGNIIEIKYTERGSNIILDNLIFSELLIQESYPQKVQISIKDSDSRKVGIGDYIEVLVYLAPSMKKIIYNSYDFGLMAYFKNIGASGYAMSDIEIVESDNGYLRQKISILRNSLYYRFIDQMGYDAGNIAAALFLGEARGINRDILQNMRFSGISHILCVSGLHISLVTGIIFFYSRILLNLSSFIAWNFNIKKISALLSILGGYFYLLLTGFGVASIRAFVMSSLLMLSIAYDKRSMSLRSVAIAAFGILCFRPEYVLFPSFQLSFIAVLSLISGFKIYVDNRDFFSNIFANISAKIFFFNIYSTILANIATIGLVIYHFHIVSNYAILSNLLIVPIVTMIIMPLGIFTLLMMFLKLDPYVYIFLIYPINLVIKIVDFITKLPFSIWYFGHIDWRDLLIYLFGFLWIIIWQSKIRYLGIICMFCAFLNMCFTRSPDLIVNLDAGFIGYKNPKGKIELVGENISKFYLDYIGNYFGQKYITYNDLDIYKHSHQYQTQSGHKIAILFQEDLDGDIIIDHRKPFTKLYNIYCEASCVIKR